MTQGDQFITNGIVDVSYLGADRADHMYVTCVDVLVNCQRSRRMLSVVYFSSF